MSFSCSLRPRIASSGLLRKSSRLSLRVRPFRNRLSRSPFALRSRSKTYLLKERHGHSRRHREIVVLVQLLGALVERAAHDEPHDHLGALVAALLHEVLDRHG